MKTKVNIVIVIFSLLMNSAFTQEKAKSISYYEKMTNAMSSLNSADDYQSYFEAGQLFRDIAEKGNTKWVPFYHAGYAYIQAALTLPAAKETLILLDSAQIMLDKTIQLGGLGNSKILCLQGYLYYAQQFRTPNNNTNILARKATQELDRARFIDASNPRPDYVIGLVLDQLDPRIGGNKKSACKHFQDAEEKFNEFTPKSKISPNWGAQDNAAHLLKCNHK